MTAAITLACPAAGLMDVPWPPVYPKQPGEPPRVAPSRARKADWELFRRLAQRPSAGTSP
jgi:hypothetical protein